MGSEVMRCCTQSIETIKRLKHMYSTKPTQLRSTGTVQANYPQLEPDVTPSHIEAVTVCVNHADILAHTLPLNKLQLDHIVVVTAPEDTATRRLCEYWSVTVVLTDKINSRWGQFCKGAGINEGLAYLHRKDFVLHMDADVVLPPHFHVTIDNAELDRSMIYGCDRAEFKSYAEWQRFHGAPEPPVQGNGFFIHHTYHGRQLGTRVAFPHKGGYIPIGFFQLWSPSVSGQHWYPEGHTDAGKEDAVFPTRWPRSKRGFLPEITVAHLESEDAPMGQNWRARKSKPFTVNND
jgi:hypothetical protein